MKRLPLLLEIIIVFTAITVLVFLGINKYNEYFNHFPRYTVNFEDLDGLSVGSPVRFSGVHIGHVTKQELKDKQITVTFKVTDRTIKIPDNSMVGVEFTGLGGSRSLEIKPPTALSANSQGFYKVEPIRVTSFLEIQNEIFGATLDLFNGILSFLNQNEKNARANLKNAAKMIEEKTVILEDIKQTLDEKSKQTAQEAKKISKFIKETNENIGQANKAMQEFSESKNLTEGMEKLKESSEDFKSFIESNKVEKINNNVKNLNNKIIEIKDKELGYIEEFNKTLQTAAENLEKFADSLSKKDKKIK